MGLSGAGRGKSVLPKNYLEKALGRGVVLPVQGCVLAQNGAEPQEMEGSPSQHVS